MATLPVLPDGRLDEATDLVRHPMPAAKRDRQEAPHPHSIVVCPENRYAFCPDLGLDRIMAYRLDLVAGRLHANTPPWVDVRRGAGPRHLAFHPSGRFAYLINELDNTVCSFAYRDGVLDPIQTISSLPEGWSGTSLAADIHLSPDGRFVYGSNRGHDSIVIYAVDATRGTLTLLGHESTRGTWPRSFTVDPAGRYLLVANERSDSVVSFRIDARSDLLMPSGRTTAVPAPACVKVLAPPDT